MTRSMENKVTLVVGGSSGIGRASAIALAAAGAKVVVAARREAEGQAVVEEIRQNGGEAIFFQADATKGAEVERLVAHTVEHYGRLDCAFNNMGISAGKALIDHDEAEFDYVMNANVKSVWLCMKYQIPRMLEGGGGSIVNMSSYLGHVGHPNAALYSASKHAIIGMTRSAALCYAQQGIRVNALSPGVIGDTPMIEYSTREFPEAMAGVIAEIPLRRTGKSAEVGNAVVWLLSELSSFVTGHALLIDGGHTAQ